MKPLDKWAGKQQSDAAKANNYDRDASGDFVHDGFADGGDPNAMGPTMRPLYDATAGAFTGERGGFNGADMHNDHYPAPLPRSERSCKYSGAGNAKLGGDDGRDGPDGSW